MISKDILNNLYWRDNLTQREIGVLYGIPIGTMPWIFKKYGIKARDTFKTKKLSKIKLKELYIDKSLSCVETAKIMNVSAHTISKYLKLYNFKVRPESTYKLLKFPKDKIISLYLKKHWSANKIAKLYNTGAGTITHRLKKWGIDILHGKTTIKKCVWCNKAVEIKPKRIKGIRKSATGKFFCSRRCAYNWATGLNAPAWKGGISCESYCDVWADKEFKEDIKIRDNHKCQNPDCWGTSDRLTIHHIDFVKKNCHPDNLITLCNSCNTRANTDCKWHTAYYRAFMQRSNKVINF